MVSLHGYIGLGILCAVGVTDARTLLVVNRVRAIPCGSTCQPSRMLVMHGVFIGMVVWTSCLAAATFDVTCVIAIVSFLTQGVSLHCILHLRDLVLVYMGCAPRNMNSLASIYMYIYIYNYTSVYIYVYMYTLKTTIYIERETLFLHFALLPHNVQYAPITCRK